MNLNKTLKSAAALAVTLTALTSCDVSTHRGEKAEGTAIVAVDESFQRIMEQEIEVYEYQYPQSFVLAYYLPENQCIDSLLTSSNVKTAVTTRPLTASQEKYLADRKRAAHTTMIAVDAIAIIANPANPINRITVDDLGKILTGELTEWKWVEPGNNSGKIQVAFDYEGSSTVNYMVDSIMHGKPFADNVYAQNSNDKVFDVVAKNKGAIGIIGVSWISADMRTEGKSAEEITKIVENSDTANVTFSTDVKVLSVARNELERGVQPYQAYIFDGSYPLYRPIYMINTGKGGSLASRFYAFVTSPVGQKLLLSTGVLPGKVHPRIIDVSGN